MTSPQEQFSELTRRTQENFKHLWEQWSQRSNELLKGVAAAPARRVAPRAIPRQVLDAVFDFAENLIAQQRAFAKQMLRAASQGQQTVADVADPAATRWDHRRGRYLSVPASTTTTGPGPRNPG